MIKGIIKEGLEPLAPAAVDTGDAVSLGDRTLRFFNTPYLHWPDTQCTYLAEDGILFTGDVFGCHFCDTRLFNDCVGDFSFPFDYYYKHIMRPFRSHVLSALELLDALDLEVICPAHGPILRDAPAAYVQRYRELAAPTAESEIEAREKVLLVIYVSAYGNTERMAEAVGKGAHEAGGVRVSLFDLAAIEVGPLVDFIEGADGLVIGSPTINGDAVKPVWNLLSSLTLVSLQGKLGAAFGSYGWSGEAVQLIEDRLRGLKLRVPQKGLRLKLIPTDDELQQCRVFGRDLALHLTGRTERRVIDMAELA